MIERALTAEQAAAFLQLHPVTVRAMSKIGQTIYYRQWQFSGCNRGSQRSILY